MSRVIARMLSPEEHIIRAAGLHWVIYQTGLVLTLAGALLGHYGGPALRLALGDKIAALAAKPLTFVALAIVALGTIQLLFAYIRQVSTDLVITNRRVIAKTGFIATTTFELMLPKVEGANIDQSVSGRLLGFGTVRVHGTGGGIAPIDYVAGPFRFHAALMKALERARQEDRGEQRD
jgi:hypothetical protein